MRTVILTLTAAAGLTMPALTARAAEIVANEAEADATHIYWATSDDMGKLIYQERPQPFAQGWRDGWEWASEQNDLSSDQVAENMERKLYGNINDEPGQTKAIGFDSAMFVLRLRAEKQRAAGAGLEPKASSWNGVPGGSATEQAIKDSLNDPGSYQFVRSFKRGVATYNGTACWEAKVVYRAKSKFGALVEASTIVYLTGGDEPKVLGIETDISPDQDARQQNKQGQQGAEYEANQKFVSTPTPTPFQLSKESVEADLTRAWQSLTAEQRTQLTQEERNWVRRRDSLPAEERIKSTAERAKYLWSFVERTFDD
jgi:hypothetical protein